jgi:hypothetical protein
MATVNGAAGTDVVGGLSSTVSARFQLFGSLQGAGLLSSLSRQSQRVSARFTSATSLSAVDSIIQLQVNFLSTSTLTAIIGNPLTALVGDPKKRLVIAVEIDTVAIS